MNPSVHRDISARANGSLDSTFTLVDSGAVAGTNWSVDSMVAYVSSKYLQLYIICTRTTADKTVGAVGDIGNETLVTLPASLRGNITTNTAPAHSGNIGRMCVGSLTPSTGVLAITAVAPGGDIVVTEKVSLGGFFLINA